MTKALTYSSLLVASLLVIFGFITAQSFSQLAVAIILYPALVIIALNLLPRSKQVHITTTTISPTPEKLDPQKVEASDSQTTAYIADIDKRSFIKLIGATGISFFLFSLLGRRAENFFFGKPGQLGLNQSASDDQFGSADPFPTNGYKIAEIDEGIVTYYGFNTKNGAWMIMREDANTGNFRYAKGESDFPGSWNNRENLKYDYFYNTF